MPFCMFIKNRVRILFMSIFLLQGDKGFAESAPELDLNPFPVVALLAVETLAIGFEQPVSALRQDARVDLQSRGGAERQSDVTVRGGLFENTGFRLGALNLFDPQTGHYFSEVPVDPAFLTGPRLLLGSDNALYGFNSTVATVQFEWAPVRQGVAIQAGVGSYQHRHANVRAAHALSNKENEQWWIEGSLAAARGDGPVDGADYDFERLSLRLQRQTANTQSDFFVGYTDKFYGWPGMYTGNSGLRETDHYQLTILGAQHQFRLADGELWQMGISWRRLVDDYQFNRSSPNTFFQHETQSWSFQGHGAVALADLRRIVFSWTLLEDKIVRSTSMNSGHFNQRSYLRAAAAWEEDFHYAGGSEATWRLGVALDYTNRDGRDFSPFIRYEWRKPDLQGHWLAYLEWVQTMQVPGYTALNSAPRGAFGGNADLERERARTAELGIARSWNAWSFQSAVFHRWDRDLVDWTFNSASPSLRQANSVDLDVIGWESTLSFRQNPIQLSLSYAYLDKTADYGDATVDASYYALNYAQHRLTFSAIYDVTDRIQLQADTALRRQRDNALRQSSGDALELNLGAVWTLDAAGDLALSIMGENLNNSNFQHFPGAVATRRQITGQIHWRF